MVMALRSAIPRMLHGTKSQCVPLTREQLLMVFQRHLTSHCTLRVRMHVTVYFLMFVGMLRYSDAQRILVVHKELFHFVTAGTGELLGLLIFIPCSKTDQGWDGAWIAIGATDGNYFLGNY